MIWYKLLQKLTPLFHVTWISLGPLLTFPTYSHPATQPSPPNTCPHHLYNAFPVTSNDIPPHLKCPFQWFTNWRKRIFSPFCTLFPCFTTSVDPLLITPCITEIQFWLHQLSYNPPMHPAPILLKPDYTNHRLQLQLSSLPTQKDAELYTWRTMPHKENNQIKTCPFSLPCL